MRLMSVLLLGLCVHVSAKTSSQTITFSGNKISLESVLSEIRKQTGYDVIANYDLIRNAKPVSVHVKEEPLERFIPYVLRDQHLAHVIKNKTIFISASVVSVLSDPVTEQLFPVKGVVKDANGNPLSGVSVVVRGTGKGTQTDGSGSFTLNNMELNDVLEISLVGYEKLTYKINSTSEMVTVVLKEHISSLEESVVIGYGTSKKKDLTGSVATVNAKEIENIPFNTFDNALAGKVAGVQVTKSDGTPGGAVRIRVRGSTSLLGGNDPLYVIDGVPVQAKSNYISPGFDIVSPVGNDLGGRQINGGSTSAGMSTAFVNGLNSVAGLNVDDIESITVLKDASATAIYGSKAANGVVMITTKIGKKNTKGQIFADYYTTYSIPRTSKVLNAGEYKTLLTEAAQNEFNSRTAAGRSIPQVIRNILEQPDNYFGKANTDWVDLVTQSVYSHNAEISIQGGGAASKYYSSVSYNSTPGVLKGTDFQRIAGKLNVENEVGKRFRTITNLNLGYTNQNITNGAYGQALRARPDYSPFDSAGNYTNFSTMGDVFKGFQNPVALTTATNNSRLFSLLGSLSGVYDIAPGLQFKSTVSLNMQNYNQRNYHPSYLTTGTFLGAVSNSGGIGGNSNSQFTNWFIENTLNWNKTFNENHSLNLLGGTSYETKKLSFFSSTAAGYPNDNALNNLSSAITPVYTKGDNPSKPQSYLLSFYTRANYTLMDKYLFTFTARADGSSKFGPDNKFGYFPSGAVAWRVSEENFLQHIEMLEDLKLRASYGLTGTQNIGDQMYRTLYSPYSYANSNAFIPTQLGNPSIKWETTKEMNLGIDFSLFKDRLQGTADYYRKQTNGALLSLPIAPSSSYSLLLNNIVDLRNTGFELFLQGDIIRTKDFRWNTSVNITWNKSLVTKLDASADLGQIGNLTGLEYQNTAIIEGQPLGLIMGYEVEGIIKTQEQLADYKKRIGPLSSTYFFSYLDIGDPMYVLDEVAGFPYPSKKVIANAAPKFYGGFTQGFSYKRFDLNFYFTFSAGGKLIWGDHISSLTFVGAANANRVMLDRFTPSNTDATHPRLMYYPFAYYTNLSVFSSSYVKLRTLTANYNFSQSEWMKRSGIRQLTVFASGTNLFTITKYPGNDPETSDDPYSVGGGYFDVSNFPTVKTFSAGVKIGF